MVLFEELQLMQRKLNEWENQKNFPTSYKETEKEIKATTEYRLCHAVFIVIWCGIWISCRTIKMIICPVVAKR